MKFFFGNKVVVVVVNIFFRCNFLSEKNSVNKINKAFQLSTFCLMTNK